MSQPWHTSSCDTTSQLPAQELPMTAATLSAASPARPSRTDAIAAGRAAYAAERLHHLALADGRTMSYGLYGADDGPLVVVLDGPGSRGLARAADGFAKDLGIRLVAPDRPGFFESTYADRPIARGPRTTPPCSTTSASRRPGSSRSRAARRTRSPPRPRCPSASPAWRCSARSRRCTTTSPIPPPASSSASGRSSRAGRRGCCGSSSSSRGARRPRTRRRPARSSRRPSRRRTARPSRTRSSTRCT